MAAAYVPDYAIAATETMLATVLAVLRRSPGVVADGHIHARMRRMLETLLADPRAAARSTTLAADIARVIDDWRAAAAEPRAAIDGLERLVTAARAATSAALPDGASAVRRAQAMAEAALGGLIEALGLAAHAAALTSLLPRSHDEALGLRTRFVTSTDTAILRAADRGDTATLRALRTLQAAVTRDLIERGRPLARLASYETAVPLPAVTLAHRLYQDAGRAAELAAENGGHDHPGFMPTSGRAMSR